MSHFQLDTDGLIPKKKVNAGGSSPSPKLFGEESSEFNINSYGMGYHFKNNDPIANTHTDEADIVMSYMDRGEDHGQGQYTFSRYVQANLDEDEDDIVIRIDAIDNCNGGMFSLGDILMDAIGGELVEFSDEIRVSKEEIEDRKFDDTVDIRTVNDLVIQDIKEWSDNMPFKSGPEPFPEQYKIDF